ncbi:hypothetical protein DUI87_33567 [Hirundo rustica rustica]|uniref:RNase H type-1 domain-containing protein n=1 Tax=Hirundo rustica rustica TaxID=333673 RepID=A0A3M0J667_HIRRU|nr:hypothetical protein DUI87_33567 [Hirundo rustica rustica]
MNWTESDEKQLQDLKEKLSSAPVLSLPDLKKEFDLFVNTEEGIAYGVLTQEWRGYRKPVAFLSKLLDPVARGWPACLQAVTAAAILIEEAQKLTLQGKIKIHTPHDLKTILSQRAQKWLTDSRILKYEIILINTDNLELTTSKSLNPAQFLSGEPTEEIEHHCLELIDMQTKVREDLEDTPLPYGRVLFTDGSSRVVEGKRTSGYSVIEGEKMEVLEKGKLPSNWPAQCCEIYALKRGLDLLKDDQGTIYTDSRYAFGIVHTFGKIWEGRGYLNSKGKDLIHTELIKSVLKSLQKPVEIAVVHIKGHQKGNMPEIRGNQLADKTAREAALEPGEPVKILKLEKIPRKEKEEIEQVFSEKVQKAIEELGLHQGEHGRSLVYIHLHRPGVLSSSKRHISTNWCPMWKTQDPALQALRDFIMDGIWILAWTVEVIVRIRYGIRQGNASTQWILILAVLIIRISSGENKMFNLEFNSPQKEIHDLKVQLTSTAEKEQDYLNQLLTLKTDLEQKANELESLKEKMAKTSEEIKSKLDEREKNLRHIMKNLKKQVENKTKCIEELQQEVNKLQLEIENMNKQHKEAVDIYQKDIETRKVNENKLHEEVEKMKLLYDEATMIQRETDTQCQHKITEMVALMEKHKNEYDKMVEEKDAELKIYKIRQQNQLSSERALENLIKEHSRNRSPESEKKHKTYVIKTPPTDRLQSGRSTNLPSEQSTRKKQKVLLQLDSHSDSSEHTDLLSIVSEEEMFKKLYKDYPQASQLHPTAPKKTPAPSNVKSPGSALKLKTMRRMRDAGWTTVSKMDRKRKMKEVVKFFA